MKYHLSFLGVLLAVLGGLSYFALNTNENHPFYFHGNDETLEEYIASFRQTHVPLIEINFAALYGSSGQFQVLHPILDVRKLNLKDNSPACTEQKNEMRKLNYATRGAGKLEQIQLGYQAWNAPTKRSSQDHQSKRDALENALYKGTPLPLDFLSTPPFVDESGFSYAYVLSHSEITQYNRKEWIESNLSFFKVSELKEILNKYRIDNPEFKTIANLRDSEIEEVVRGVPAIITDDYLLLKDESRFGFSPLSYWIYPIQDLRTNLGQGKYDLIPFSSDAVCLQAVGNACWTYNSKHALGYVYRYSLGFLILLGTVFVVILCVYLKYIYEKNKEQKRRRLSLQVLSHEFRTPVSSMLLLVDQLASRQHSMSDKDQDLITRLSSEVFRLQRIIEVSRTYLQAESGRIPFKNAQIPSINTWICDFISESDLNITSELLSVDQSLNTDPFWLKFVLSSLVQNAYAHGKEPVVIRVRKPGGRLHISVEDAGECEFNSLREMSDVFVKSSRSKGMGLGLNIAKFIVDEWGSEIRFSKYPTSFTLSLSEERT